MRRLPAGSPFHPPFSHLPLRLSRRPALADYPEIDNTSMSATAQNPPKSC